MNTQKKNTKKTAKKTVKPAYVIDITKAFDEYDTALEIAWTKLVNNTDDLTIDDLKMLVSFCHTLSALYIFNKIISSDNVMLAGSGLLAVTASKWDNICSLEEKKKKPNIFKRFWNWITCKK